MTHVLWINPPSLPYRMILDELAGKPGRLDQVIAMPMGILYLAAMLEREAPDVSMEIVDVAKHYRDWMDQGAPSMSLEKFLSVCLSQAQAPDWVGISILFSTAHRMSLAIADAVKIRWPDATVVVGGMHATNAVPQLLGHASVDAVCRGEAEHIIAQAVRGIPVAGIIRRGEALSTCPLPQDLDALPFPAWHRIPLEVYLDSSGYRSRHMRGNAAPRIATIVTTRGCPFHCTFCASWTVHGREMRYRSIPNVIREMEMLYDQYGVREFVPEDDLFTVKKSRILALCDAVRQRFNGSVSFQFPNGLSVATLDRDVIRGLKQLGSQTVNLAIESGSAYVQKHIIKKNVDLDHARRIVEICREEGFVVRCYFILGFPGETSDQMQETIRFAESLPLDWATFHPVAPLVGTEMFDQLLARKEIDPTFNWDGTSFAERTYDTAEISAKELIALCDQAREHVNLRNNWNVRHGYWKRATSLLPSLGLHAPEDWETIRNLKTQLSPYRHASTIVS